MPAKKKSSFYHTRSNKVGINEQRAAEVLGVTIEQVKQWDSEGAPSYVERLLLMWDCKHINVDGWSGWCFSRGVLKHGRQQWRPENILDDRKFRESLEAEMVDILKIQKANF